MTTQINGTTGVSQIQDNTVTSPKIVDGGVAQADLALDASSIGVGQTWQVVTRTAGNTYTNSTGKPIVWEIIWGASSSLTFTVQGLTRAGIVSVAGNQPFASFIIPAGATYSFTGTSGFIEHRELR